MGNLKIASRPDFPQDSKRINASGCTFQPIKPAKPINTPKPVGINASPYSQRWCVSAVTASKEMAIAMSASDKSNWSSLKLAAS